MTDEEAFVAWAPDNSPWSRWAKPVLFAHFDSVLGWPSAREEFGPLECVPDPYKRTAILLDLPGPITVAAALNLAEHGYRPLPLFNALPLPVHTAPADPLAGRRYAVVDVLPIIAALRHGASALRSLSIPADAPPVFMLDANRQRSIAGPSDGRFDNRSICFTTDFPSANFLVSQRISRIMLIQQTRSEPQPDLLHVLCRMQDAGLTLELATPDSSAREPLRVRRPPWYKSMWQRAIAVLPLKHNRAAGFGGWMHDTAASG